MTENLAEGFVKPSRLGLDQQRVVNKSGEFPVKSPISVLDPTMGKPCYQTANYLSPELAFVSCIHRASYCHTICHQSSGKHVNLYSPKLWRLGCRWARVSEWQAETWEKHQA